MKLEYYLTSWPYEFGDGPAGFRECNKRLETIKNDGWKLVTIAKGVAYFERPIMEEQSSGNYSYDTVQDGYVIFGRDGKLILPYELVKILGND